MRPLMYHLSNTAGILTSAVLLFFGGRWVWSYGPGFGGSSNWSGMLDDEPETLFYIIVIAVGAAVFYRTYCRARSDVWTMERRELIATAFVVGAIVTLLLAYRNLTGYSFHFLVTVSPWKVVSPILALSAVPYLIAVAYYDLFMAEDIDPSEARRPSSVRTADGRLRPTRRGY